MTVCLVFRHGESVCLFKNAFGDHKWGFASMNSAMRRPQLAAAALAEYASQGIVSALPVKHSVTAQRLAVYTLEVHQELPAQVMGVIKYLKSCFPLEADGHTLKGVPKGVFPWLDAKWVPLDTDLSSVDAYTADALLSLRMTLSPVGVAVDIDVG